MKNKFLFLSAALITVASLTFTGCRKEHESDNDTSSAEDNALADKSFEDMHQMSNEAAQGGSGSFREGNYDGILSACATVTKDTVNKTITIDFGASNCLCMDGRYRRGKVFVSYSGQKYWDSLAYVTITTTKAGDPGSDSYYVGNDASNMNHVVGTKTVTNKGHISGCMTWHIVANGTITKANGNSITWSSTRDRRWISGESTPIVWSDDVYGVTGSASGTASNGNQFNATITQELIRRMSCPKHFVDGKLDFTPGSKATRHIDFGYSPAPNASGSCDSWISITINSKTYYKELK